MSTTGKKSVTSLVEVSSVSCDIFLSAIILQIEDNCQATVRSWVSCSYWNVNVCGGYGLKHINSRCGSSCSKTVDCGKVAAAIECAIPDADHAVGDDDARQASAARECANPDAGDAVGNDDTRQAAAALKCAIPDAGDAVGDDDARQAKAALECATPDTGHAVGNDDARQAAAALEYANPDAGDAVANDDARQASAEIECALPDAGDAVADGDARQTSAAFECFIPDAGDAVGNGDARQAAAAIKCVIPDAGDAVGYDDARQWSKRKCQIANACYIAADVNATWLVSIRETRRRINRRKVSSLLYSRLKVSSVGVCAIFSSITQWQVSQCYFLSFNSAGVNNWQKVSCRVS